LSNAWGNIKFNAGIDFRDFIRGDFTPQSIRLRKRHLDAVTRKREAKRADAMADAL